MVLVGYPACIVVGDAKAGAVAHGPGPQQHVGACPAIFPNSAEGQESEWTLLFPCPWELRPTERRGALQDDPPTFVSGRAATDLIALPGEWSHQALGLSAGASSV